MLEINDVVVVLYCRVFDWLGALQKDEKHSCLLVVFTTSTRIFMSILCPVPRHAVANFGGKNAVPIILLITESIQ